MCAPSRERVQCLRRRRRGLLYYNSFSVALSDEPAQPQCAALARSFKNGIAALLMVRRDATAAG